MATILVKTSVGEFKLSLDYNNAPNTAKNFQQLVEEGYYSDCLFHRVIAGFMVQGGGFSANMVAKDERDTIDNEANQALPNKRGTIAMARTSAPHSASTQFFINLVDNGFLDYKNDSPQGWGYCVFGEVTQGMEVIDEIAKVKTSHQHGHGDVPISDIIIESTEVLV